MLLRTSPLAEKPYHQKLFLCSSFTELTLFSPASGKAFAFNFPLLQNIFLAESVVSRNIIRSNTTVNNARTLSSVIAHKIVHSLLENKLGLITYRMRPAWKNEGYCDFIANEISYNYTQGLQGICRKLAPSSSNSFKYFKARLFTYRRKNYFG